MTKIWNGKVETRKDFTHFCKNCGWHFNQETAETDACPKHCGANSWEIAENTIAEKDRDCKELTDYENSQF